MKTIVRSYEMEQSKTFTMKSINRDYTMKALDRTLTGTDQADRTS